MFAYLLLLHCLRNEELLSAVAQEAQYEDSSDCAQRFLFITLTGIPPTGFAIAILIL